MLSHIMAARPRYRFYVNRTEPAYRLVLLDSAAFPDGTDESEWQLTRERDEDDVNADVRGEIAARGYCLFAIGLTLDALKRRTDQVAAPTVILETTITCPKCGHAAVETMPVDACQFFYDCKSCGTRLKPKAGDCCVYCSYGSVRCPPMQAGECCQS